MESLYYSEHPFFEDNEKLKKQYTLFTDFIMFFLAHPASEGLLCKKIVVEKMLKTNTNGTNMVLNIPSTNFTGTSLVTSIFSVLIRFGRDYLNNFYFQASLCTYIVSR